MSYILSFKLPDVLLKKLAETSQKKGTSKGAIVRQALEKFFNAPSDELETIKKITENLFHNKPTKLKTNWDEIYKKVRESAPKNITPEEEVRRARNRFL